MEKTTLYLPAELSQALKRMSQRLGRSQADLIREALTRYLGEQPRPRPKSIGSMSFGGVTGAESEDWLREHWEEDWR